MGVPEEASRKRKATDTPEDGASSQLVIQFFNQKEEPVGCQFSVPKAISKAQLEQLLLQVLTDAAKGQEEELAALEGRRFSLSLGSSSSSSGSNASSASTEITETLGAAFAASDAKGAEEVLRVSFSPLAAFRVSPLTRCSSALPGHEEAILAAAFSPEGKRLATGGGDTSVRLWDLNTETPLQTLRGHSNWVLCVSWASHGQLFASSGMDGTVCIWDADAGALVGPPLKGHTQPVVSLAWQPLHLVSSEDVAAEAVADSPTADTTAVPAAKQEASQSGGKDDCEATRSNSSSNKNCKAKGKQLSAAAKGPPRPRTSSLWKTRLGFTLPSLLLASGSKDGTVRLWRVGQQQALRVLALHTQPVTQIKWSGGAEGYLISGSRDTTVKVWNPHKGTLVKELKGHAHWVNTLALNSDSVLRRGPFDPRGRTERPFTSFAEMKEAAQRQFDQFLKECGHEALLSGSDDSTLILRRIKGNGLFEEVGRMTGHQKLINCVCFSPDGLTIASGSFDKSIRLWKGATGQYLATLRGHVGPVYQLAWAADSRLLLSGSGDSTLKVWDVASRKLKHDLPGHADEVYAVDWSPTGTHAASGSKDRILRVWKH
ncbi:notchless protein homolog 1 [Cyclospora cayetanensis]|uniref:Notchless protein homolog 1 n=1 Tax=Cyclospora cayetanensis TaxID=88456 RepID=A0A6P6S3J4_9EIME|nr:notchless protein homolog 1 [Cyclospora cayetanensis]